jgi:hypothetical protein
LINYFYNIKNYLYIFKLDFTTIQDVKTPSSLQLVVLNRIAELRETYLIILHPGLTNFLTSRLLQFLFYIMEYSLYIDYHSNGKNTEFEFMIDKNLLASSNLKLNQLPLFSNRNCLKVGKFTKEGMFQYIFDVNVVSQYLSLTLPKDLWVNYGNYSLKNKKIYFK